jgi:hypothetical protein
MAWLGRGGNPRHGLIRHKLLQEGSKASEALARVFDALAEEEAISLLLEPA